VIHIKIDALSSKMASALAIMYGFYAIRSYMAIFKSYIQSFSLRNLIYDCDINIDTTGALLWYLMFLLPTW
jgi:hypothetical protein